MRLLPFLASDMPTELDHRFRISPAPRSRLNQGRNCYNRKKGDEAHGMFPVLLHIGAARIDDSVSPESHVSRVAHRRLVETSDEPGARLIHERLHGLYEGRAACIVMVLTDQLPTQKDQEQLSSRTV